MVNCRKCDQLLVAEDAVVCNGDCKGSYHYNCAQVREIQYRKRTLAEKQAWLCPDCKNLVKNKPTPGTPSIEDVYTIVMNINLSLASLQKEMKDIAASQQFLSNCYEEFSHKFEKLENMNKEIVSLKEEVMSKDKQIKDLSSRVIHSEQYSRRRQLELTNVTSVQGEDLHRVVVQTAALVGVTIDRADIDAVHRLPSNRNNNRPPIIVEFSTRRTRDQLLSKKNTCVVTNKSVLGAGHGNERVFINESLSPYFKNLLWLVKKEAKNKGYKFCWYRSYKILVKKNENEKIIYIAEEDDLKKLI